RPASLKSKKPRSCIEAKKKCMLSLGRTACTASDVDKPVVPTLLFAARGVSLSQTEIFLVISTLNKPYLSSQIPFVWGQFTVGAMWGGITLLFEL
ncbi:hypothetical protein BaRGS_00010157, partial [Batillaria attramentaria]